MDGNALHINIRSLTQLTRANGKVQVIRYFDVYNMHIAVEKEKRMNTQLRRTGT